MTLKTIDHIFSHNSALTLHTWLPEKPKGILFYIHGLQSHGGWLFETGEQLAKLSIAVYALDRRGSGLSEGARGDVINHKILLGDYALALNLIRNRHANLPLALLGQSLGGSILAGLITHPSYETVFDKAIFLSPALGQNHHRLTNEELYNHKKNTKKEKIPTNLNDNDYTENLRFLKFIKDDPLCLREITCRSKAAFIQIEDLYWNKKKIFPKETSTILIHPKTDPIIHTESALNTFCSLTGGNSSVLEIPTNKHYIEFSSQRSKLWECLTSYILKNNSVLIK